MILNVPILIRREQGGRYVLSTLGPPDLERAGMILEDAKAKLARDLREALRHSRKATVWKWFALPEGRADKKRLRVEVRMPGGSKEQVLGRFTTVSYDAPGELPGKLVLVPRADLFLHVPENADPDDVASSALGRAHAGDPAGLRALAIAGSEWVHLLEVELEEKALVDKERTQEEKTALLGASKGRRRKRTKEELEHAPTLLEVGLDLCAFAREGRLAPAHGRDAVLRELEAATQDDLRVRAALLVGEPGTGKTAILQELARRIEGRRQIEGARGHRGAVFSIQASRLMAGMRFLGDWQDRCLALVDEAEELGALLHFDSLPALVAAGRTSSSERTTVAQLLKPFIASGRIAVSAEATPEGLRRATEIDRSLVDLFRPVRVREPLESETLEIALRTVREIEARRPVVFDPRAARTAIDLLRRFVPYEAFPGKACRFLERMAEEKAERVTSEHAIAFFSRTFGLAPELLEDSRPLDLAKVRERFVERVRGQDEAVSALVDAVATLKAGLKDPEKPLASLLFVGPTGVGKTESAKALAEVVFGSEDRLVRFDLNEASDAGAAERLAGSPFQPEGELTRAIRERPFAVVLLDEVEKAHPVVLDLLLQLLGEGRLTDALGRTADARNIVFVLTSNLGADRADRSLGFDGAESGAGARREREDGEKTRYRRAVEDFFRPELVNRLDRIVSFVPLGKEALRAIAAREVDALLRREGVSRRRILLEADDELLDLLVSEGVSPRYGARPLRRAIERRMAAPLAAVLSARPKAQDLLVSLGRDAQGEVAIRLEELTGLGPIDPFPRPGEEREGTRPLAEAREVASRLFRLERSSERSAITRALVDAAHGSSGRGRRIDESQLQLLNRIETDLLELRHDVDALLRPIDDDGYEERDEGMDHVPDDDGKGRGFPRRRIERTEAGAPRPEVLHALRSRLDRLELLVRTALEEPERVVLHLSALGGVSRVWVHRLAWLYEKVFESLGIPVISSSGRGTVPGERREVTLEVRSSGARAWLAGEAGLHESLVLDEKGEPSSTRSLGLVRVDAVGTREVVRKYIERRVQGAVAPERIDDLRLELTAKASERKEGDLLRAFVRPLEDLVLASALSGKA